MSSNCDERSQKRTHSDGKKTSQRSEPSGKYFSLTHCPRVKFVSKAPLVLPLRTGNAQPLR